MTKKNKTTHFWIFISAYGVFFAFLSFIHEIITKGMWWKGVLALILGFALYRTIINRLN